MSKIDPKFSQELKKYGAKNLNACFNCGNCTAVCSLSTEDDSFPREMVRYSTLGLQSDIKSSLKPWLCYYCGECSETCPQEANPGVLMMTLRRWLTAKYDWTGLSGIFYRSLPATIFAFALVIIGVISFSVYKNYDQEVIMHFGHLFEIIAISAVFLLIFISEYYSNVVVYHV
jgi:ferredoxin